MLERKEGFAGAGWRIVPLCILLVLFGFNLAYKLGLVFSWAPELGGFERNVIWGVQQMLAGRPLYTNPNELPFAVIQYMPLYYHLVAFLAKIFQVDPQNVHGLYICGRLFSLLLSLASTGLLFLLATRKFRVSRFTALAVSFLIFCLMEKFSVAARPDALKAFFFISATVFFSARGPEAPQGLLFYFGGLCCAFGAFLSKQDGLVALGILPLAFLFFRKWKLVLIYSLVAAALLILLFFFFHQVYAKQFLANVAGGLQNGISLSWFIGSFTGYFSAVAVLFGLSMVLAYEFFWETDWSLRLLSAAWVCSFFPALFFSLKYGSGPNYFFEATLISGLFLAIWLDKVNFSALFIRKESLSLLAVFMVGLFFLVLVLNWSTSIFLHQESALEADYKTQEKTVRDVEGQLSGNGRILVLAQKQWLEYYTCLLADRVACPQRDVSIQMFNAGKADQAKALQPALDQGQIQALITDQHSSPAFLDLDFSGFEKKADLNGVSIWTHKSSAGHP